MVPCFKLIYYFQPYHKDILFENRCVVIGIVYVFFCFSKGLKKTVTNEQRRSTWKNKKRLHDTVFVAWHSRGPAWREKCDSVRRRVILHDKCIVVIFTANLSLKLGNK